MYNLEYGLIAFFNVQRITHPIAKSCIYNTVNV